MSRFFVPLDVHYQDDDKIAGVSPLAELLYIRALALAKRTGSDGLIKPRQCARLMSDLGSGDLVGELTDVGLWATNPDGWTITGWFKHNTQRAESDGALGNHKRWHVDRGVVSDECAYCIASDIGGESGANRGRVPPESQEKLEKEKTKTRANGCSPAVSVQADFDAWWPTYPRRVAKQDAQKAYTKARRTVSAAVIAEGLEQSKAQWDRENRPADKVPYAATWLNRAEWDSDFADPQTMRHEWDG